VSYTNKPEIISAQPNLVAINNALGVDLEGRVIADAILRDGHEYIINGLGGQADFIRHAKYPVIVLTSTIGKPGQEKSRITIDSQPGITQTVIPHDGAYIVTEYGLVNTFGLTRSQKAYALTQIAHPDFREELINAARERYGKRLPSPITELPKGTLFLYDDLANKV
jgi:4-hydroxybutyrate CoA-transferase